MSTNHCAQLDTLLKQLQLGAFLEHRHDLAQQAEQGHWPYEDFLLALLEFEVERRTVNRRKRLLTEARFPIHKELVDFDFTALKDFNRSHLLHLVETGSYLSAFEPLIFVGNPGLGKTHLAISLGQIACRQSFKTRFYNSATLVNDLMRAQEQQQLQKFISNALSFDLVILDELGFIPFTPTGAQLLFQFCSALYEQLAFIVTTNLPFSDWPQVFGDARLTAALIDRLTFHAHIFEFRGQSYRLRHQLPPEAPMSA